MAIPTNPPGEWFQPPAEIPTDKRITITADGRVYGYIALWNSCHVGMGGCVKPPKGSPTDYGYAHQGETLTAEGDLVATAVIAGGAGHAAVDMETAMVPSYYENTGTQLMRVRYGEDENGLWFAGALWPNVDDLQVAQIRASSISGDWRWHAAYRRSPGGMDFMGSCLVNIPGFPMKSDGGLSHESGSPYAIAASATYAYIVNEEETEGKDMSGCNGECEGCGCNEPKGLTLEDVASAFGLEVVQASAEPTDIEKLTNVVTDLKDTVDSMVADRLLSQIQDIDTTE